MKKTELTREYKEALAKYLEPIALALNETRTALGLTLVDITQRAGIEHEITYFKNGFFEGAAGYFDKWYEDKKAFSAYQAGNFAGREFFSGEFQTIGYVA